MDTMNAYAEISAYAADNGWTQQDYTRVGTDGDHVTSTRFVRGTYLSVLVDWTRNGQVIDAATDGSTLGRLEVTSRDKSKRTRVLAWLGTLARRQDRELAEEAVSEEAARVAYQVRRTAQLLATGHGTLVDSMNALDRAMAPVQPEAEWTSPYAHEREVDRRSLVDISNALDRAMAPIVRTGPANKENEMSEMIGKTVKSVLVTPFTAQDTYGDTITGTRTIISFTDGSEFTAADLDIELFNFEEQAATISPALAHQALTTVTGATSARWER